MKSILVVDDNKMNLAAARTVLGNEYRVIPVMKGTQALAYLEDGECDIILLDINMPEMDGFEVLKKIRWMEHCRNIPVIFLTADADAETETRCFKEGAVDFIAKPFVPEVMLSRIGRSLELEELRRNLAERLEQKTKEVSAMKSKYQRDALTGLWDRLYTEEKVNQMLEWGSNGALMMIDIDNFKSVNDSYGHITGDKMLKALADTLRDFSSEGDVLCRIGGDEFMVFMKDVTSSTEIRIRAAEIISELHNRTEALGINVATSISIGIAQSPDDGSDFTKLYNCADKALYYVKRNGKNSYHFFSGKLQDEKGREEETISIKDLQELMLRIDTNKGAYLLDVGSFRYVYNFIRRFADRSSKDVSTLLFTVEENENAQAMNLLEKTICTFLRRSDVITRYSSKQFIVVLMDINSDNSNVVAERIIDNFNKAYTGGKIHIDYSIARIDNRFIQESSKKSRRLEG